MRYIVKKKPKKILTCNCCNNQCSKFPIGSIVYYIKDNCLGGNQRYCVSFGVVTSHFPGEVQIELYDTYDNRTVNGVPINELVTPTRWRKIPKGWDITSNQLVKIDSIKFEDLFPECSDLRITNPNDIKKAISSGFYIKVRNKDYGQIMSEIDDKKGWRIVREYTSVKYHAPYRTVKFSEVYSTYDEAQTVIDNIHKEWMRQASLTDEEWSIEQINKTIDRWAGIYHIPEENREKLRKKILELDRIEDVEVRIYMGNIEWKYWRNKRWNNI